MTDPLHGRRVPPSAARPGSLDEDRLPCGAWIPDLVDQADAGALEPAGAHQAACPDCSQALRAAAVTSRALQDLVGTAGAAGTVPTGLVDRVLREVRETGGPGPFLELPDRGRRRVAGRVRVRTQVIADLVRAAAAAHPGVTVVRCTVDASSEGAGSGAATGPQPGLRVHLGLLVDGQTPLPDLARRLRRTVRSAVRTAAGVREVAVELTALDLVAADRPAGATDR